jgi:hypothetical protein
MAEELKMVVVGSLKDVMRAFTKAWRPQCR